MIVGCAVSAGPAPIPFNLGSRQSSYSFSHPRYHSHACPHEAAISVCLRSPDAASEADNCRKNEDWASTKARLDRNPSKERLENSSLSGESAYVPDEVTKTKN
jgi:hypothetical protein